MDYSEKYGNSVEEAVELALKDLKATRDQVEISVLEEPSKGFLGIGSKLAKVRVEVKEPIKAEPKAAVAEPEEKPSFKENTDSVRTEKKQEARPERKFNKRDNDDRRPERKLKKSIVGNRPDDLTEVTDHKILDFLKETTEKMGLELSFKAQKNDENIYVDIEGKDAGTIIGKRGQTLDAIQYLTSLVINKENQQYIRVVLDAENYRAKREKTLEQLADRLAGKVVKTKRPVRLEPMNPYERMVIHATLQGDERVITRSEGDEPYRRVIIELK
ncbi:MAG: RNA-binding cell elongation regulator Jag/EloR [Eubacteriaceae bacterium]|nr:RNA-binding cell elongation regulator Jag/EloR [Eubacteriaceae bacterium]